MSPAATRCVDRVDADGAVEACEQVGAAAEQDGEIASEGKDAAVATMRSPGTWDGAPRPGRYRIVPAPMNGEPGGMAYVREPDGRYRRACLTVRSLDADGLVAELTTFVLPELFAAWGFPLVLDQ